MILFVNACVRSNSRTKKLADYLLSQTRQQVDEIRLADVEFPAVDEEFLIRRDRYLSEGKMDDPMFDLARKFSAADIIVIAAPFWDLSFPSVLKQYFEQINAVGVTFRYSEDGVPIGLCKASKLYYVTTAGGYYFPEEYGFGYIRAMANAFYGISDVEMIKAVGLDVVGADEAAILRECINGIIPI